MLARKRDFETYIRRYTSRKENFEYGYPHSNARLTFSLQKNAENVLCCDYVQWLPAAKTASELYSLINQQKATLYYNVWLYCCKFMILSNQMSR